MGPGTPVMPSLMERMISGAQSADTHALRAVLFVLVFMLEHGFEPSGDDPGTEDRENRHGQGGGYGTGSGSGSGTGGVASYIPGMSLLWAQLLRWTL